MIKLHPKRGGILFGVLILTVGCSDQADRLALLDRAEALDLSPLQAPPTADSARIDLGESLFFDPILSGNRDQSCAACHALEHALSDGRSLSVGTAAVESGGVRIPGPDHSFTPRNAPSLWDVGQAEIRSLFWDGRLAQAPEGILLYDVGHESSQVARLIFPGETRPVVVQPLFPVLDRDEMRGDQTDPPTDEPNELATIFDDDFEGVWNALMERILSIEDYAVAFAEAFPDTPQDELELGHAAAAIADYMDARFESTDTPWDRFIGGDEDTLSPAEVRGATLFFGEAQCSTCHRGNLFSDQELYNYGIRPLTRGPSKLEFVDLGAQHRTHAAEEGRYAFRTPRLRNVVLTGPWMHNGAYTSLEAVLAHKTDPVQGLWDYDSAQLETAIQPQVHNSKAVLRDVETAISSDVPRILDLSPEDIADIIAFLGALTSPSAEQIITTAPERVFSGLPTDLQ